MTGHYKEPYSKTIDQLRAENKRLKGINADLLEALKAVVKISDRKHDAWDIAKAVIAKCEEK